MFQKEASKDRIMLNIGFQSGLVPLAAEAGRSEWTIMKPREAVKQAHEDAVISEFLDWYNLANKSNFKLIAKPEPPDAIAKYLKKEIWIEHADIYRSAEEAREERSAVTPGEKPYNRQEHPIFEPDKRTANALIATLKKKIQKNSYEEWFKKYGGGFLILTERDPPFDQSTWDRINDELKKASFQNDKGFFESVYLGYRSGGGLAFIEIKYRNS